MVHINLYQDVFGHYNGFNCSGHAEYAERGSDIICAGISTLTQTTVIALEQLLKLELQVEAEPKTGQLRCVWVNKQASVDKSDLLVETMIIGLKEIQNLFPEHLSLSEAEVLE